MTNLDTKITKIEVRHKSQMSQNGFADHPSPIFAAAHVFFRYLASLGPKYWGKKQKTQKNEKNKGQFAFGVPFWALHPGTRGTQASGPSPAVRPSGRPATLSRVSFSLYPTDAKPPRGKRERPASASVLSLSLEWLEPCQPC